MIAEYIVVVVASILAGVGTGLVGLSAATAMVPLMIVLCPTFMGEQGVYMATAIALASDVLASAVTSATYAKNKNIDLRRGGIFFGCILVMSIVGSIVAYFTPPIILGGYSLIMCVLIGLRFVVMPESKERVRKSQKAGLTGWELAVSIGFGIGIGFCTAFFGSGGGLMMLVVLTTLMSFERKTAVGTSTFIMTFTALVASVSHIFVEPAIILDCWSFLLVGVVTTTIFALLSARFANKVSGEVTGYVTGITLFLLGIILIVLNNVENVAISNYVIDFIAVSIVLAAYVGGLSLILIIMRYTTPLTEYMFRKLIYAVVYTSIIPMAFVTDKWLVSILVALVFYVVVVLGFMVIERFTFYKMLFQQKTRHKIAFDFAFLYGIMVIFLFLFWGIMGEGFRYIAITSIMAWGPADTMATVIGSKYGQHKLRGKLISGEKSIEGTVAMAVMSFACTLACLLVFSSHPWYICLGVSLFVAPITAAAELYSPKGYDTLIVPTAAALTLCATLFI